MSRNTGDDITVRRGKAADIEAVVNILHANFAASRDLVFNADTQRTGMELLLSDPARYCVMVAEALGALAGIGVAQTVFSATDGALVVEIEGVLVARPWQGKGVEGHLLVGLEDWASRIGSRVSRVLGPDTSKQVLSFYDQLNWESTQMRCLRRDGMGGD
jgi:GNAT superfamily N-acetyltransferase